MYYIYHIPGVKIGCTDNVQRRIEQQGYSSCEILESYDDIFKASNRELALQKKYGYEVDKIPYFKSVEQWGAKAGRIGGKNAQPTLRKLKVGLYTKDKQKRKEWATIGGYTLMEKYGKEWFSERGKKGGGNDASKLVCSKPIIQLDKNNNFIKQYKSISEAGRETGIGFVAISNCLRGKTKTSGGYKWEYQK
jgi:hypothetical protein